MWPPNEDITVVDGDSIVGIPLWLQGEPGKSNSGAQQNDIFLSASVRMEVVSCIDQTPL